jgi:hypothetical protein
MLGVSPSASGSLAIRSEGDQENGRRQVENTPACIKETSHIIDND